MFVEVLSVLAGIFGVLMSLGHFPQAYRIWKNKSSKDVSLWTYSLFAIGSVLWLLYGIATMQWPIIFGFVIGVIGSVLVVGLILMHR